MAMLDFENIFNASPNPYMLLDKQLRYVAANRAYLRATASELGDLIGKRIFDVFPDDPDDPNRDSARMLREALERVFITEEGNSLPLIPYIVPKETPQGKVSVERYWSATHTPIFGDHGEVCYVLQHTVDVTQLATHESREAEPAAEVEPAQVTPQQIESGVWQRAHLAQMLSNELYAERRRLLNLFEQAPGFMCVLAGPEHCFELANKSYEELVGQRELIGKTVAEALPEIVNQGFVALLDQVYETAEPFVGRAVELYLNREVGAFSEKLYLDFIYQPIIESSGSVRGIFVQGHDVTEQVLAQQSLKRHQEKLEQLVEERTAALAESQTALQRAQRMESVGRLTGGIAHDFNNLLQIISGNLQLLQLGQAGALNDDQQRYVDVALQGVVRGKSLSSQLLSFARKQPLQPKVTNISKLIRSMDSLLERAITEDIQVSLEAESDVWRSHIDPHQLEHVILNLAINAQDAMPNGGELRVRLSNHPVTADSDISDELPEGDYVLLEVSDTGIGIAQENQEHIFEPFFTTKSEGRGTGLGLSMAYGFIKQSGGHIQLESELGAGAKFSIYLPRCDEPEEVAVPKPLLQAAGGSETILVVEDEHEVRATAALMLEGLGYTVLQAQDAASGLALLETGVKVDLLFTDVIMPGPVSCSELAKAAVSLQKDLRVLFTSGYTQGAMQHNGRLLPGVAILKKPYSREALAEQVRAVLSQSQPEFHDDKQSPVTVLLVEDECASRQAVSELLKSIGYSVLAVGSGEEALSLLMHKKFDILLTDVNLPGMSGFELIESATKTNTQLRTVVLSGLEASQNAGAKPSVWLTKPFDIGGLKAALREALALPVHV